MPLNTFVKAPGSLRSPGFRYIFMGAQKNKGPLSITLQEEPLNIYPIFSNLVINLQKIYAKCSSYALFLPQYVDIVKYFLLK